MRRLSAIAFALICAAGLQAQQLTISADKAVCDMSPLLYGVFFEDINFGADGGLVPNMIRNHSFEYYPFYSTRNVKFNYSYEPMTAWEERSIDGAEGQMFVTGGYKLAPNNLKNLNIIRKNDGKGYLGVSNTGYDGISVKKGSRYSLSFHAHVKSLSNEKDNSILFLLEDSEGKIIASHEWKSSELGARWTRYETEIVPQASCGKCKASILFHGKGVMWLDMVCFQNADTFNGHGLRKDLVQAVKDLKPAFLRFPGGCIVHAADPYSVYIWKETVGPVENRVTYPNIWGYFQSNTLGYYEYFVLCEDLGMEPLPVVPLGVTCGFDQYEAMPMEDLHIAIEDALDVVEFANGDIGSEWGRVRAEMGHPEPFNLKYIALGNEEHDTPEMRERFPLFVDAFKLNYPEIKLIGTSGLGEGVPLYDLMKQTGVWSSDEHYYNSPEWFLANQHRFDNWDRKSPKVFVGEFASPSNKLYNCLCEGAYILGCERNSDIVEMLAYAPLFKRYEFGCSPRVPVFFDNDTVVCQPNYYMQQMFASNMGTKYLAAKEENWPGETLVAGTSYDDKSGDLIVKIINVSAEDRSIRIKVEGAGRVASKGERTIMSGAADELNTREEPFKVSPVHDTVRTGRSFTAKAPAYSVQVIRINLKK